jgi:hypothetical protein
MTTYQSAKQAWKEYHKGISPEVMPEMTPAFLYAFKKGIAYEKDFVSGHIKDILKKYRNDGAEE